MNKKFKKGLFHIWQVGQSEGLAALTLNRANRPFYAEFSPEFSQPTFLTNSEFSQIQIPQIQKYSNAFCYVSRAKTLVQNLHQMICQ